MQVCQDPMASTGEREAAVRVLHTVLSGRHWPEHHACLAGAASSCQIAEVKKHVGLEDACVSMLWVSHGSQWCLGCAGNALAMLLQASISPKRHDDPHLCTLQAAAAQAWWLCSRLRICLTAARSSLQRC